MSTNVLVGSMGNIRPYIGILILKLLSEIWLKAKENANKQIMKRSKNK
jgi:hypothetical protein